MQPCLAAVLLGSRPAASSEAGRAVHLLPTRPPTAAARTPSCLQTRSSSCSNSRQGPDPQHGTGTGQDTLLWPPARVPQLSEPPVLLLQVLPCTQTGEHCLEECPFAHPGEKATRRDPRVLGRATAGEASTPTVVKWKYSGISCPSYRKVMHELPAARPSPFCLPLSHRSPSAGPHACALLPAACSPS